MKRLTFALLSALSALPLVAQMQYERPVISAPTSTMKIVSETGHAYTPAEFLKDTDKNNRPKVIKKTDVNDNEGEKVYYSTVMSEVEDNWGNFVVLETPSAAILVKQEDDKVSLMSPYQMARVQERKYLDGVADGDKLKFNLPLILDEDDMYITQLSLLIYDPENSTYNMVEDSENLLEVQVGKDGSLSICTSDVEPIISENPEECVFPEIILGVISKEIETGEFWWEAIGSWNIEYTPCTLNTAPDGLVFEEWSLGQADPRMKYSLPGWNRIAGVAIDGNDIYIKGISEYCEDSIIKGTIENGIATFSGMQAAGYSDEYNLICFFVASEASLDGNQIVVGEDVPMKMILDMENKTLTSENVMMWCVVNPTHLQYMNAWYEPMCIANTPDHLNAPLEAPSYQNGTDVTSSGLGYFMNYYIPNINVNGCVLDKAKMYYNVYINENLFTFTQDKYFNIPEDMTDISAEYTDGNLFIFHHFIWGEDVYTFWFMFENYELYTVGVQSFYLGSDDVLYSSPLNHEDPGFYPTPNSLQSINESAINEEYYTIDGMRIENPQTGLFIKISKMSDGSRKVEKVRR